MPDKNDKTVLVSCSSVSLFQGQKVILSKVNFELKNNEIVGVVGKNGAGKSSFLKLISQKLEIDDGKIAFKKNIGLNYLAQESDLDQNLTIFETVAKAWIDLKQQINSPDLVYLDNILGLDEPWKNIDVNEHKFLCSKVTTLLNKFNFFKLDVVIKNLSGGEKRKISLASKLIGDPDILILDEPTNHLDIDSIELLEKILKEFKGGVLLVSHDRYFLDKVTNRIVEIFDGNIFDHPGNYQSYLESKKIRQDILTTSDERKQGFLKQELNWVNAGVKARGTKDKGRLDRYYNLKEEKRNLIEDEVELLLPPSSVLGNKIISFENVTIQNESKMIIKDFSFSFHKNTKIGIIGSNGSGKTSIIKAIVEEQKIAKGRIVVGMGTKINYQDQHKFNLDPDKNAFLEIGNGEERTSFGEVSISTRKYLKRFLFDNQQILTPIKFLSGGEKSRLLLAKILKAGGNCLILDEPTNDLDLETISLLEKSIQQFEGVTIIVSHDRYFLNQVCNNILALDGDGNYTLVLGNYDQYLSKIRPQLQYLDVEVKIKNPEKLIKQEQKVKQQELKKTEKEIAILENKIKLVEEEFTQADFYIKNPNGYGARISHLSDLKRQMEKLMKKWEESV